MSSTGKCPAAIGVGSNLGDARATIARAVELLVDAGLADVTTASLYETEPVGCAPGTRPFTNSAITGTWSRTPLELLYACRRIEQSLGRPFPHDSNADRTIDLDVLLLGEETVDVPELRVPHPQVRNRLFVLVPLAEIAPAWRVPPTFDTVTELRGALQAGTSEGQAVRRKNT